MDPLTLFVTFIISAAVSYAAQKKAQQAAKKAADASKGVLINRDGTTEQIPVVYGTRRVGGIRVYASSAEGGGSLKNDQLYIALVFCEGPVESISDIHINGEPYIGSKYQTGGFVSMTMYLGTDAQTADPTLVALNDGWTTDHRLQGLAYMVFQAGMSSDIDENPWTGGLPEITALVKGRTVYDPRDESTGYSSNAALCIRDYLTNTRYGKGLSTDRINDTLFNAAATLLDTSETLHTTTAAASVGTIVDVYVNDYVYISTYTMTFTGDVAASFSLGGSISSGAKTGIATATFYDASANLTRVTYIPLVGTFATSDAVSTDAATIEGAPFGCHAVLDTSDTLFENVIKLLQGCKGFMPYTNGKYGLIIDDVGSSVLSVNLDHVVGGIKVAGVDKKDKFNQITITFADPAQSYQPNQIIFPEPGSATDTALLAEDDGERLADELEIETIASSPAAYNLAKTFLYRSRFNITVAFVMTSEALALSVGDVIDLTHSAFSWSAKLFKVEALSLNYDGTVQVDAREYNGTPYVFDSLGPVDFTNNVTMPNTTVPTAPTSLVLTEVSTIANDGSLVTGLQVAWTASVDALVNGYEVQWKTAAESVYNSVRVSASQTVLSGLQTETTYNVRVRAINVYGSYSAWIEDVVTIDGDTTAPGVVSSLSATASYGSIYLEWTNPTDYDFWQAKVYVSETNVFGDAVLLASIAGDAFVHSGLGGGVTRYYWVVAIDGTGNASTHVGSVTATTLSVTGVTTYYQDSAPGSPVTGDLWFDTNDGNAAYRWSGSAWQSIDNAVVDDFNSQNNRNTASITAPNFTFSPSQSAFAISMPEDETYADLLFNWRWGGTEGDIDGFQVIIYASSSAAAYDLGTTPHLESTYVVPANTRAVIFYGIRSDRYYTVGVRAYRRVDSDLDSDGIITSTTVKSTFSGDNPFRPDFGSSISSLYTEVYDTSRNIGSVALTTGFNRVLANMASDGVLTPVEKLGLLREWNAATSAYNEAIIRALAVGVSTTALTVDYDALGTYLNGGLSWAPGDATPKWLNAEIEQIQTITPATFKANWTAFYNEYDALLTSINNVNVSPGNPIDTGNVDDVIDAAVITSAEDSYNTPAQAGGGITTFYTLASITVPIVSYATKINLQWNMLQDYAADADFHLKITRQVDAAGKTTLGDSGVISERTTLPGGQIVDIPPTSGTNVVYRLEWAGETSDITCVTRLVLAYLRR